MKIEEIKSLIKRHDREKMEKLVIELYKAIPKKEREARGIDLLIETGEGKKDGNRGANAKYREMGIIEEEVKEFASNARQQYYLKPNRVVNKSKRAKWRFEVKNLYKELMKASEETGNTGRATDMIYELYSVMTHACDYQLFRAYDVFDSIGITQEEFFESLIILFKKRYEDKRDFIRRGIKLIIEHPLNRHTLYKTLMHIFIKYLEIPDLKNIAIETSKGMWEEVNNEKVTENKNYFYSIDRLKYKKESKLNNLVTIVFLCYASLFEIERAKVYYKEKYIEREEEVKLYILIDLLLKSREKEHIVSEIESFEGKGGKPRESLIRLKEYIMKNDELPEYIR